MRINRFEKNSDFLMNSADFVLSVCYPKNSLISVALSGGGTPKPIYEQMAKKKSDFSNVDFFQIDERYVDKSSPFSNYKMIYESLIKKVKVKSFNYFNTSLSIEDCLNKYEMIIPDEFDLAILGMGNDGHVASLFPFFEMIKNRKVEHTVTDIFDIKDRVTVTMPMILRSKKILLLLKGKEKEEILNKLVLYNEPDESFPASFLKKHPDFTINYCIS